MLQFWCVERFLLYGEDTQFNGQHQNKEGMVGISTATLMCHLNKKGMVGQVLLHLLANVSSHHYMQD